MCHCSNSKKKKKKNCWCFCSVAFIALLVVVIIVGIGVGLGLSFGLKTTTTLPSRITTSNLMKHLQVGCKNILHHFSGNMAIEFTSSLGTREHCKVSARTFQVRNALISPSTPVSSLFSRAVQYGYNQSAGKWLQIGLLSRTQCLVPCSNEHS